MNIVVRETEYIPIPIKMEPEAEREINLPLADWFAERMKINRQQIERQERQEQLIMERKAQAKENILYSLMLIGMIVSVIAYCWVYGGY